MHIYHVMKPFLLHFPFEDLDIRNNECMIIYFVNGRGDNQIHGCATTKSTFFSQYSSAFRAEASLLF